MNNKNKKKKFTNNKTRVKLFLVARFQSSDHQMICSQSFRKTSFKDISDDGYLFMGL